MEVGIAGYGAYVRIVGDTTTGHIELAFQGSTVRVYLYDANMAAIPVGNIEASITIHVGKTRETVKLLPAGLNVVEGKGGLTAGPGLRAIVVLKQPGQPISQARFSM